MPLPDPEYSKRIAQWHAAGLSALFPDDVSVGDPEPVYDESGAVVWYEVPYLRPRFGGLRGPSGYALVCTDPDADEPVAEFATAGFTNHTVARSRAGGAPLSLHRYGPGYYVAEAADGAVLAEVGQRPRIVPDEVRRHKHRVEGRSGEAGDVVQVLEGDKPPLPADAIGHGPPLSHADFKAAFHRPVPSPARLTAAWEGVPARDTPDVPRPETDCQYVIREADGWAERPRYRQLPAHQGPNQTGHLSGCGPTAWLELFGYHDRLRSPGLLPGDHPQNDDVIDALTMRLHDALGTSGLAGQGFTWPSDMFKGYEFARTDLGHYADGAGRQAWFDTDESWVYEVARASMAAGLPFIVGYYEDWHYALGLCTAECATHGWEKHAWILVDFGGLKWIPKGTIFAAFTVARFLPARTLGYLTGTEGLVATVRGPGEAAALTTYAGVYRLEKRVTMQLAWHRETVRVELSDSAWPEGAILQTTATAWLAAIGELDIPQLPESLGFAVDEARAVRDPETGRLWLELDVSLRGPIVELLRIGYTVRVVSRRR